ncbi:MAG: tryptophan synthase subunit alpha [Sphaerochaeta sp.]|nr:tryptophan synthase subunit alpha [Sphaerochaeta sp.]
MNERIESAFNQGKAFIPFITCGDPDLATTKALILAMATHGADLIELGIPFSDPIAEGPVIQEADVRSLASGTTTDKLFDMVKEVRAESSIPLVFMTYINPIFTYGKERFLSSCKEVGIDGIIVPDMPFEEQDELEGTCRAYGISLISMIAPTSKQRIEKVASQSEGFLYCVSSLGVTGTRDTIDDTAKEMVQAARHVCSTPCAIGFGISNEKQAEHFAAFADGIIVGSAIVRLIAKHGQQCVEPVALFVESMKAAANRA